MRETPTTRAIKNRLARRAAIAAVVGSHNSDAIEGGSKGVALARDGERREGGGERREGGGGTFHQANTPEYFSPIYV